MSPFSFRRVSKKGGAPKPQLSSGQEGQRGGYEDRTNPDEAPGGTCWSRSHRWALVQKGAAAKHPPRKRKNPTGLGAEFDAHDLERGLILRYRTKACASGGNFTLIPTYRRGTLLTLACVAKDSSLAEKGEKAKKYFLWDFGFGFLMGRMMVWIQSFRFLK